MNTYTASVEIMNGTLVKLGAARISSQDEDNPRARILKERYPVIRDRVLTSHPWNFSVGYYSLAPIDPKPDDVFDYEFVFQLPADMLRVTHVNLHHSECWEEIEGNRIAANVSELKVKGIKRIADVTKFPATFGEALEWALAVDTCYAITQSTAQLESCKDGLKKTIAEARSFDAQVGSVRRVIADDWLESRFR